MPTITPTPKNIFHLRKQYLKNIARLFNHANFHDSSLQSNYGRVDLLGNAVYPSEKFLAPIPSEGSLYALNFVADAFKDFRAYYLKMVTAGGIRQGQGALSIVQPIRGWESIHTPYGKNIDGIYAMLVKIYFEKTGGSGEQSDRRPEDFEQFMGLLNDLLYTKGDEIRLTRSSFVLSRRNGIATTGLAIEITPNLGADLKKSFFDSPNFKFYMNSLKKFGFMADVDYPGRIIADIGSPEMQHYMAQYGITVDNLFEKMYYKASDFDYYLLKVYISQFYNTYAAQYPSKTVTTSTKCGKPTKRVILREQISADDYSDNYWLSIYVNTRNFELSQPLDEHKLKKVIKNAKDLRKNLDISEAIRYIGDTMRKYQFKK
jgi:hypothetical protein